MKTLSIKEYLKARVKHISITELITGLAVICFLMLLFQLTVIGLKGLLVLGLIFTTYRILKMLMSEVVSLAQGIKLEWI